MDIGGLIYIGVYLYVRILTLLKKKNLSWMGYFNLNM